MTFSSVMVLLSVITSFVVVSFGLGYELEEGKHGVKRLVSRRGRLKSTWQRTVVKEARVLGKE